MERIVAQPLRRELVHRWRWDAAAECAELPEPSVINQDEHDIGRAIRGLHGLWELRRGAVEIRASHAAREMKIRSREYNRRICRREQRVLVLRESRTHRRQNQT